MVNIFSSILHGIENITYLQLVLIVALESTAVPIFIPVETIIIPLGYLASIGKKNIFLLAISSTTGVVIGCLINYLCSFLIGRFAIYKYAKYFFIKHETIQRIEKSFLKNADFIIFIGRFIPIPGIKHLVTLPAGFSGMNIKRFTFFSFLGGLIFSIMTLGIGYFFGTQKELITNIFQNILLLTILVIVLKLSKGYIMKKIKIIKEMLSK